MANNGKAFAELLNPILDRWLVAMELSPGIIRRQVVDGKAAADALVVEWNSA